MPRMRFPEVVKASSAVLSGVVGSFFQESRQIISLYLSFSMSRSIYHGHASQCQGWNLNFQKLSTCLVKVVGSFLWRISRQIISARQKSRNFVAQASVSDEFLFHFSTLLIHLLLISCQNVKMFILLHNALQSVSILLGRKLLLCFDHYAHDWSIVVLLAYALCSAYSHMSVNTHVIEALQCLWHRPVIEVPSRRPLVWRDTYATYSWSCAIEKKLKCYSG